MKPKILVLTKRIKSYWQSPYAKKRVNKYIESKNSSIFQLLITALFGFIKSKNYDLVITADPRIGVFFGLFSAFSKKKPFIIDQMILSDKIIFFKDLLYKFALKKASAVIVNSSYEVDHYKKRLSDKINFVFLPIPADNLWFKNNNIKEYYIFSGGGEKRDYKSLLEIAAKVKSKFIITVFSKKIFSKNIPENCEIIEKVSNQNYIKLIGKSLFVVVPLLKTKKSAGQTTLVQAMCQKKAVIIADNPAINDYVKNSALLYQAENKNDLLDKINTLLNSKQLRASLEVNALKFSKENLSYEKHDKKIGEIIKLCLKQ